jgi:hypothetical protein
MERAENRKRNIPMSNKYLMMLAAVAASAFAQTTQVSVNVVDVSAGKGASGRHSHGYIKPGAAPTGRSARSASSGPSNANSTNSVMRFPGDLTNSGGAVIAYAQSHAIYMNPAFPGSPGACNVIAACWGDPEAFLRDLGSSEFIHIADQYVNSKADNRYTVGRSAMINYVPRGQFQDDDILSFIHSVAASTGQTGYGHIYHVFLPPGQDVCQSPQQGGGCFSTTLCAYHASANFFDIGHVVYSVEPDQLGGGCEVTPGSPNGPRVDSTNNVLSHELFETITDPDFDAWFNKPGALDLQGEEIGDECSFYDFNLIYFDVPTFKIGKKLYAVQREWDNSQHGCSTKPAL